MIREEAEKKECPFIQETYSEGMLIHPNCKTTNCMAWIKIKQRYKHTFEDGTKTISAIERLADVDYNRRKYETEKLPEEGYCIRLDPKSMR